MNSRSLTGLDGDAWKDVKHVFSYVGLFRIKGARQEEEKTTAEAP